MPTIGGRSVDVWLSGDVPLAGITTLPRNKAGVDGEAAADIGIRGQESTVITKTGFTTDLLAALERVAYNALKGSIVTVIDPHGVTWNYLLVVDVVSEVQRTGGSVGLITGTRIVTATWTFRATVAP